MTEESNPHAFDVPCWFSRPVPSHLGRAIRMVGEVRIELTTSGSQNRRATTALLPYGGADRNRTCTRVNAAA